MSLSCLATRPPLPGGLSGQGAPWGWDQAAEEGRQRDATGERGEDGLRASVRGRGAGTPRGCGLQAGSCTWRYMCPCLECARVCERVHRGVCVDPRQVPGVAPPPPPGGPRIPALVPHAITPGHPEARGGTPAVWLQAGGGGWGTGTSASESSLRPLIPTPELGRRASWGPGPGPALRAANLSPGFCEAAHGLKWQIRKPRPRPTR